MTAASEHGTFRLTYTPPEATGNEDYPLITVEMSTPGDANVDQMLRFYEAFLAASGYLLKGDLQVVEPGSLDDFVSFGTSSRTDYFQYGAAQPTTYPRFDFDDDVVSFG